MRKILRQLKRREFNYLFKLCFNHNQRWLLDKEDSLIELMNSCENQESRNLIFELLMNFHYLDHQRLGDYLNKISDFIINDSGFHQEDTQIAAITYDDAADSSQKILDYIKMPLFEQGWDSVQLVNRYGAIHKNFKAGKKNIIFIDEFIGSGQTLLSRIKQLNSDIRDDFHLVFCFVAGMDNAIRRIEELGYKIFCPLRLPRGISEFFTDKQLEEAMANMLQLESKLAQNVNSYELKKYSLGYNAAEALYSLEGCLGNTPNSVFPIFWWPRDTNNSERKRLLTRYEKGLK